MKKILGLCLLAAVAAVAAAQQAASPASKAAMPELSKSDVDMAKLEQALSTKRRELFAAGMGGLSADQMQTFWGVYADFEKERDAVASARLSLLKSYTDKFATLSDADVVKMVNESAEIQKQTLEVRMKYFGILNQKLGAKAAGRFAHIDDYLTTIGRLAILDNMPALQVAK
jgi:uncharacterized protein